VSDKRTEGYEHLSPSVNGAEQTKAVTRMDFCRIFVYYNSLAKPMGVILRFCYKYTFYKQYTHKSFVSCIRQRAHLLNLFSQKKFDYEVVKCRLTGVISEEAVPHGEEC
jgi:hypothetical protein